MNLSPKTKRNFGRLLPFGLIWLVTGWVFLAVEYAATDNFKYQPGSAIKMDASIFAYASMAISLVGLVVGAIELFFLNKLFIKKSFGVKILSKLLIYAAFLFLVILVNFPIAASFEMHTTVFDSRVWQKYFDYLTSITHLSTSLQMGSSLGLSLFYAEISDNLGQGVLLNFFTGKYHKPKEETRIFMFADMKSSTTIAEKLGHITYFQLLREYYFDLTEAVIANAGEIYQYVGDEMVISWKLEKGVENGNCLRCFQSMKADLQKQQTKYLTRFGVMPDFKAGYHFGKVTAGEIGGLKKEIIFTGDVLNATARIQSLCNQYQTDLMISAELLSQLPDLPEMKFEALGEVALKGKEESVPLFALSRKPL